MLPFNLQQLFIELENFSCTFGGCIERMQLNQPSGHHQDVHGLVWFSCSERATVLGTCIRVPAPLDHNKLAKMIFTDVMN